VKTINGKKVGGTIRNWQLHTLSKDVEGGRKIRPDLETDKIYKFSGTVVDDPLGRWQPGDHMVSSVVLKIDRENGIIETMNTIYHVKDEGGDIFEDLGSGINAIFY